MKRFALYVAALIVPPLMIGVIATFSQLSSVMIQRAPHLQGLELPAPPKNSHRLQAALLVSNQGTQVADLLGAAEVLAASDRLHVFTVAPERIPSVTTGAVGVLPHFAFKDAPQADLLVIPAVLDPNNPVLAEWVRTQAKKARLVLVICEGARLAAQSGLLAHHYATSHIMALEDLERSFPTTTWLRGRRYILDDRVITTAGVSAALDGALFSLEKLFGRDTAEAVARKLSLAWNRELKPESQQSAQPRDGLRTVDVLQILLRGGFDWYRGGAGVLLYPGVSDLAVAAPLDVLARTQSYFLFTVAARRGVIRTRAGVDLIPTDSVATVPPAEVLFVPSRDLPTPASGSPEDPLSDPEIHRWVVERSVLVKSQMPEPSGGAFNRALAFVSATQGPAITDFVSRMIEFPNETSASPESSSWPLRLLVRPVLLGLFSLALVAWLERRFRARR